MALDGAAYSPKEFELSFATESVASGNIGEQRTTGFIDLNVDSVEMPSFNPTVILDPRTGTGRTAKSADAYVSQKGMVTEVNFSGIADTQALPLLVTNLMTQGVATSPASYDIPFNYSPPELQHNVAITSADDYTKTLTIQIANPEADDEDSIFLPGCVLTSLSLSGDIGTDNGRITMSGTFKTQYKPNTGQSRVAGTPYTSNYYYLTNFNTTKKIAGASNCVIQSMTLNLENPTEYVGFQGANADPEAIVRAIPEISANMDATIKMDDNTAGLHTSFLAGSNVATMLSNAASASWTSATVFGIQASYGRITSVSFNESAAMYLDVSQKFLAGSSGDLIQLVV
tara:strand:- start:264 stop:1292 length:1029 start_codon:yes stop_codon:yes gene_type:complete